MSLLVGREVWGREAMSLYPTKLSSLLLCVRKLLVGLLDF
jgi:hypothetical protein